MNTELDARANKVMDFINAKAREQNMMNAQNELKASPEIKMRKLNEEYKNAPSVCIDTILGKVYKNALPFNDPKKNCSDDEARDEIRDYISKRTNGKNSEWYVREAIKRTGSSTLQTLLNESVNLAKNFLKKKSKDIGQISIKDLNYNANSDADQLDQINKNLELDEISTIIQNNVQRALQDEQDKAKREEEYNKQIEDSLTQDDSVTDDASMEEAVGKMNIIKRPTVYQPSLFEAILLGKAKAMQESVGEDMITEAIHEYTKLNISKALRLERFDLNSIRKLANSYLS